MDELVPEPEEFGGIEGLHQSVGGRTLHFRNTSAAGMVREPDVEWSAPVGKADERYSRRYSSGIPLSSTSAMQTPLPPVILAEDTK